MSLVTDVQGIAGYDQSSWRNISTGLPQALSISRNTDGQMQIVPVEGGGLGYGIGNALRSGFEHLAPKISGIFQGLMKLVPDFSLFQGVSAAEIPDPESAKQKKGMVKTVRSCSITEVGSCDLFRLYGYPSGLTKSEGLVFIPSEYGFVSSVNVNNPSRPFYAGSWRGGADWEPQGPPAVLGSRAYVGYSEAGVQVLNVNNPSRPFLEGYYNASTISGLKAVKALGSSAYTISNSAFTIINVTNPLKTSQTAQHKFNYELDSFDVDKTHAFIGSKHAGLDVLSISNPKKLAIVGDLGGMSIEKVARVGNTVFALGATIWPERQWGIQSIDVSNPSNPSSIGFVEIPGGYGDGLAISENNLAFTIGRETIIAPGTLYAVDITNPSQLSLVGSFQFPGNRALAPFAAQDNFIYVAGKPTEVPFSVLSVKC